MTMSMRTRRQSTGAPAAPAPAVATPTPTASDDEESVSSFSFAGKSYATYQEMVDAKRRRNRDALARSGLLEAKAALDHSAIERKRASPSVVVRGLKRSKASGRSSAPPPPRRKSSRIAGGAAPDAFIVDERGGRFEISGGSFAPAEPEAKGFYNGRVNDGSDLSISEAVELTGPKWAKDGTAAAAQRFAGGALSDAVDNLPIVSRRGGSSASAAGGIAPGELQGRLDALSLDDLASVAKVCPDRIYSVACHPSPDGIIACAGDKNGCLGIWNVNQGGSSSDDASAAEDGVYLFKPHSGPVSSMAWNPSGTTLLTASYDGSVRAFDAEKQVFEEVFATYDDDETHREKLGYGMDHGYNSWIQSMELDHRYEGGKCFFVSTSAGGVIHIDSRTKGKVTFDQILSAKKINTVSLHPDGNTMATAGLSTLVELWDVRKMPSFKGSRKEPKPLAWHSAGRSINSAFFSPSGRRLVTTTQSNTLEIFEDFHLASNIAEPIKSIKHDNQTGRWLSTLMARWHPGASPEREIFVVGSMGRPRVVEVFDGDGAMLRDIGGDALTAVASRCCFHPRADELIVVGGNSSGRVTVAR